MKNILIILFVISSLVVNSQTDPVEKTVLDNKLIPNTSTISIEEANEILPILKYQLSNVPQVKIDAGLRRVYFVHGLGGSAASWTDAADAFENSIRNVVGFTARMCKTSRIDYTSSTSGDLYTAAGYVRNEIDNQSLMDNTMPGMDHDSQHSFIIAHSQGGVVSRALLDMDFFTNPPNPPQIINYGGLVTVSSPLQGAMILNNKKKILDMAKDACESLGAGYVESLLPNIPGISNILRPLAKDMTGKTCNFFSYNLAPVFFKDNLTPITNGYKVEDDGLINEFNVNALNPAINSAYMLMPKVAFYGWEPQENLFWRTSNWILNDPNGTEPASPSVDIPVWGANDDSYFLNHSIIPMRNGYLAKKTISGNKANYYWIVAGLYSAASFFQPIFLVNVAQALYMANEFTKERNAWNEGLVWFDAEADTQWKTAIGARSFTSTSSQMFRCECHDPNDPMNGYLTDDYIDCLDENCAPISAGFITTYHISNKPNDGVVLNESAMNLPGHTHEPVKVMGELKSDGSWSGSSHMQIRNDKGLRDNMTNLLEGDYGKFFEMDNK